MNQQAVEVLLYNTALSQAVALGFRLGQGADRDIRTFAQEAASSIFVSPRSDNDRDVDVERAVRSFRLLVDTMIGVRREAYHLRPEMLGGNVIGEETLRKAKELLCPGFWPFC